MQRVLKSEKAARLKCLGIQASCLTACWGQLSKCTSKTHHFSFCFFRPKKKETMANYVFLPQAKFIDKYVNTHNRQILHIVLD